MSHRRRVEIDVDIDSLPESRLLRHILHYVRKIYHEMRKADFATEIGQIQIGENMATNFSVQAGGAPAVVQFIPLPSGSVFATPASFVPTADDPAITFAPNPGDTTGTEFTVTAPASDTNTSFNLAVSGPNGASGATISGTQLWTIIPSVTPPPPAATSIGQQQLS
jgi:hypothetical protein